MRWKNLLGALFLIIFCRFCAIACIIDLHLASSQVQTWNDLSDDSTATITSRAIQRNISLIRIGWRPGFSPNGTRWHAEKASRDCEKLFVVNTFSITSGSITLISAAWPCLCFIGNISIAHFESKFLGKFGDWW